MGKLIEFETEDGSTTKGYLATPPQGKGPGLLLMHAWWGLNGFFVSLAERFAEEGFVVLAPDLYDGRTASTIEGAEQLRGTLNPDDGIRREIVALDYLLKHPNVEGRHVGTIGFSMGGGYATWLSTSRHEVTAIVLFYGGGDAGRWIDDFANQTQASFLGHFAEHDPYEPNEAIPELEGQLHASGKEATFYFYPGTGHWFFENDRPDAFNAEAARLAWERTTEFLKRALPKEKAKRGAA